MNTLSKEDAILFHTLMDTLLLFVNQKTGMVKNATNMKELHQKDVHKTMQLREKIFSKNNDFINTFITENPSHFSNEELNIIDSWKHYLKGQFYVIKHTPEHSLFFHPNTKKVYGVKGITDSFEEKFQGFTLMLVDITLIPFHEHIIYDGVFSPYNITFGRGIQKSIKTDSEEAIHKFGVITSLTQQTQKKEVNDADLLRFYMKATDNKILYENEIYTLKTKSKELEAVYYYEEAKQYARQPKKMLKEYGIKGYFAVMLHTIIASGSTEKELQHNISNIIPKEKKPWIYVFKL